jgi:hypothetical protein
MKLTKDESRILSVALYESMHQLNDSMYSQTKDESLYRFKKLEALFNKLDSAGEDNRRNGRTSLNSFSDTLKRYTK